MNEQCLSHLGRAGRILSKAIEENRISHFYIIEGANSSERRVFAKQFIKAMGCQVDKAQGCNHCIWCRKVENGNVEDLYDIERKENSRDLTVADAAFITSAVQTAPINHIHKNIVLINEGQYLNTAAQNKLLKTLEEPTAKSLIILTVDGVDSLLETIKSRAIVIPLESHGFNYDIDVKTDIYADDQSLEQVEQHSPLDIDDVIHLMDMVEKNLPFFQVCDYMDNIVKSNDDAANLLEKFKEVSIAVQVGKIKDLKLKSPVSWIDCSQEALMQLAYNVEYKYALRACILKIGGIDDNSSWS